MATLTNRTAVMGTTASPDYQPKPRDLVFRLDSIEAQSVATGGLHPWDTLTELNATTPTDGDIGFVLNDTGTPANNGTYQYVTDTWVKRSDESPWLSSAAAIAALELVVDGKSDDIGAGELPLNRIEDIPEGEMLARATGAGDGPVQTLNPSGVRTLIGLENVDNVSDANKPISTATQAALDTAEQGITVLDTAVASTESRIARSGGVFFDFTKNQGLGRINGALVGKAADAMAPLDRAGTVWGRNPGGLFASVADDTLVQAFDGKGRAIGAYFGATETDLPDIDMTTWTASNTTVTGGQAGPDGTASAYKVTESVSTSAHSVQETSLDYASGVELTWPIALKADGRHQVQISTVNTNSTDVDATFNLATGRLIESNGLSLAWEPVKSREGFWLCAITFTPDQTGSNGQFKIKLVDDNGDISYTGDGTSGVLAAFPARGAGRMLPLPVAGGARAQDLFFMLDADLDTSLTEGTMAARVGQSANVAAGDHTAIGIASNAAGQIDIQNDGATGLQAVFSDGSSTETIAAPGVFIADDPDHQVDAFVTWTAERAEFWVDGICRGTVANPPLPGNIVRMQVGGYYGARAWGGVIARAEYYPFTIAAADLGQVAPLPTVTSQNGQIMIDGLFSIATLGDNFDPRIDGSDIVWTRRWNGTVYTERFPIGFTHSLDLSTVSHMAIDLRLGDGLVTGDQARPLLNGSPIAAGRAITAGVGPRVNHIIREATAQADHRDLCDLYDLQEVTNLRHGETPASASASEYFEQIADTSVGYFTANSGAQSATVPELLDAGALNIERAYARMMYAAYRLGLTMEAPAVFFAGGNADTDDRAAHLADVQALHDEVVVPLGEMAREWQGLRQNKDIPAPALFISQLSYSNRVQNALAQWDATRDETRNIIGVVPGGQFETSGDAYTADNSKGVAGENKFLSPAAMGWRALHEGKTLWEWHTLQSPEWFTPVIGGRTETIVTVDFNGLNDTIKVFNTSLDDTYMGTFTDSTYGIRWVDDGDGNSVSVSGATITANWQLEATLDAVPTGTNGRLEFGTDADAVGQGPTKGLRVGIRDNTSETSIIDGVGVPLYKHAPVSSLTISDPVASASRMTVFVVDDLNWQNTLAGLFDTVTPNLDTFMAASRDYRSCMASMPVCEASRASFLSGMDVPQTGVWDNGHDWRERVKKDKMLPAWLKENGIDTAMCGKIWHTPTLLDYERRTVSVYEAPKGWSINPDPVSSVTVHAQIGSTYWGAWTGSESELQDYNTAAFGVKHAAFNGVVFLGFVRPHSSNVVPQAYIDMQMSEAAIQAILDAMPTDDLDDLPLPGAEMAQHDGFDTLEGAGTLAKAIRCYLAGISYMDTQLGKVLDQIAIDDPTRKVMIFSDHGYHLGDKERFAKLTLWESACNATLMFKDGTTATVTEPVSLLDVAPTICDTVGAPRAPWHIGKNLVTEAAGADGETPIQLSWYNGAVRIRTDTHSLIKYVEEDAWEMYDLGSDPTEETNLLHSSNVNPTHLATKESILDLAEAEFQRRGYHVETGRLYQVANSMMQVGQNLIGTPGDDILIGTAQSGGAGDDTLFAVGGSTIPEDVEHGELIGAGTLTGSAANDDLHADDTGSGTLIGGAGDDTLTGNDADDVLIGGSGDDTLIARGGSDTLTGGSGNNTFIIDKGAGTTTITDVKPGDKIILRGWDSDTSVSRVYASSDTTFTISGQDIVCTDADVPATQVTVVPE